MSRSKFIKIMAYLFIAFLFIGGVYYFFIKDNSEEMSLDPLYCAHDSDCTYYSPLSNCYNAKPINKDSKKNIILTVESEDTLCGQIKTACINYQCEIVK